MNREIYDNGHKVQGKWLTAIYHWSLILTVTFLTLSFETEAGGGGAFSEYKFGLDFRFSKPLLLWPSFVKNISCLKKQTRISLIQFFFIIIIIIACDKRSLQPIFGDRHSLNSIARFFQNLVTFFGMPVLYWLLRTVCGLKGSSVEFKVSLMSRLSRECTYKWCNNHYYIRFASTRNSGTLVRY